MTTYRTRPIADRFWPKVNKTESCWLWTASIERVGYGLFQVNGKIKKAHRTAWEVAGGFIPEGMRILHTCDVRACVRNDDLGTYEVRGISYERRGHLFLGTQSINMLDRGQKGRVLLSGEHNPRAILTENDVREIRRLAVIPGTTLAHLARTYRMSHRAVGKIVNRKSWQHI